MMRRSTQPSIIMLWSILVSLFILAQARPPSQTDTKESDVQELQKIQGDVKWESQWWTPKEDNTKDSKDSWKAFKTEKPAVRRRWWEEDWDEDEWWAPKGSSSSSVTPKKTNASVTPKKPYTKSKTGEDKADVVSKVNSPVVKPSEDKLPKEADSEEPREPIALPLVSSSKTDGVKSGFILKDDAISGENQDERLNKKVDIPVAETPREKLNPGLKGDIMISPFEDPKPGPYSGPRDEAPSHERWEYHQLTGFGKYIDQGKNRKADAPSQGKSDEVDSEEVQDKKDSEERQAEKYVEGKDSEEKKEKISEEDYKKINDKNEDKKDSQEEQYEDSEEMDEDEYLKKEMMHVEEEIEAEEERRSINVPEKNMPKQKGQFYGFGLESVPDAPSAVPEKKEKSEVPVKPTQITVPKKSVDLKLGKKLPETSVDLKLPKKVVDVSKENYNKGIIYDVIPGSPEQTHSVKKDLVHSGNKDMTQSVNEDLTHSAKKDLTHSSVKKDLSKEYMEDFVSTKANPQTSPNPPPPGLAENKDSETTPLAPSKFSARGDMAKLFIKSRPLTFCKLDAECRKGRMCRDGMCVCLPSDGCAGHYKPVCGSDGVQYPSHCELHRTACITHVHIKVDHVGSCFTKHEKVEEMAKIQKENYKDHLLPPVSSSQSKKDKSDDDGDNGYDSSDYDEDEYDYGDEDEDEDEDDEDDVDEWLKSNTKKITLDSNKIYDYSKDLKKASAKKTQQGDNKVDLSPWDHVEEETGEEFKGKGGKLGVKDKDSDADSEEADINDDDDYQSDGGYKECTKAELNKFKRKLLEVHCKRFMEPNCELEVKEERDYLTNLMFSYLDSINNDYELSYEELKLRQKSEHIHNISGVCELTDLIWYDDKVNADGHLSLDEFERAFNDLDGEETPVESKPADKKLSVSPVVHIIPTLATVGNGLELKCGLAAKGSNVVWRRHGMNINDLGMVELLVLDDGSLFFSKMGVHHMGNYSCEDSTEPSVLQVHSLKVQMPPIVKVSPHSQIHPSKLNAKMKCHAEGVPKPTISWQMNNVPIAPEPGHYSLERNNELLVVYRTDYQKDTGAYKCTARNQAGTSEEVASVFIIGDKERTLGMDFSKPKTGEFAVFHSDGYTVYDPDDCLKDRSVHGDFGYFKFIPDNLDGPLQLCEQGKECKWGTVVNVKDSFLYASQPDMNRIVVIETTKNLIPVQVISTDKQPVQLHYVEHLDQVWVLCWNKGEDDSTKTIVVIRDASKFVQHRSVHTQPVGNHFDQIQALFIAPSNDLRHSFDYGYVTHSGQQALTKLDLDNMRYVKAVDLSAYSCVPRSVAFVPIGGHVVVECVSPFNHQTLQLVMDYITDAVVSTAVLSGRPHVSPDSRHVVTVDDLTGKVSVSGVNNEGVLEAAYEVTVSASISDVAFYPTSGFGYLLVLTSADDDNIITINLSTGNVAKMKGTDDTASADWRPSPVRRSITSGDIFSNFLLTPCKSSLVIMDMKFHHIACEYPESPSSQAAVFIGRH